MLLLSTVACQAQRFVKTVDTIAQMRAQPVPDVHTVTVVKGTDGSGLMYQFLPSSTLTADNAAVVQPTFGSGTGRYVLLRNANPSFTNLTLITTNLTLTVQSNTTINTTNLTIDSSSNTNFFINFVSDVDTNVFYVTNLFILSATNLVQNADTAQQLAALGTDVQYAGLSGYNARADGGGGMFVLTNTATGTNLGTRIASSTSGYSWDRIYSGPLNVKWFGARGNGTTDDRTAITNAIAVADTTDGHVFFPAGIYRVSSAVAVPTGVSLSGVSFNNYFDNTGSIITNSGSGATFTFTGDSTQANSVPSSIERLKIVGHSGSSHGIHFTDAQIPIVSECYIYRHGGDGIRISSGIQAVINKSRFQSNANNVYINSNNTTTHITDCRLEDASAAGAAIQINGANDGLITINACTIESNEGRGIWVTGGQVLSLRVEDNWFEGNLGAEDVYLQGAAAQYVGDFEVSGNRFNSSGVTTSLRLDYASDGIVSGNLFSQAGTVNFSASANTQDILFLWNRLAGSYSDSGTRVIRQERGVTYEIGVNAKLRGDLDMNNNAINTTRAVATDANRFVLSATNSATGGGTTSRGFKVKIADNDATDIVAQFHNFNDTGLTLWGDNRAVFDGQIAINGTSIYRSGAGTPEGAVTAPISSIFTRNNGGAGTTLYVKESGAGNTGWIPYYGQGAAPTFASMQITGLTFRNVLFAGAVEEITQDTDNSFNYNLTTDVLSVDNLTLAEALNLANTTSSTVGVVNVNSVDAIHFFGTDNTFVGESSGNFTLSGANNNTALGKDALDALTSGDNNVAVGLNALTALDTALFATAVGSGAGAALTSGSGFTAVGGGAGDNVTSGDHNTLIGFNAGAGISTTDHNTVVGANAYDTTSSGFQNTIIGSVSAASMTDAANNTFVGFDTGAAIVTGGGNTLIGSGANVDSSSATNRIAIGRNATATADYTAAIGGIGNPGGIIVNVNAGNSSTQRATLGGVLFQSATTTGNIGTGVDNLYTNVITINALSADLQTIEFWAAGTLAANANNKQIIVNFGGTAIGDTGALAINGDNWECTGRIIRTGASTQKAVVRWHTGDALLVTQVDYTTPAESTSGAIAFTITGEATSDNDITIEMVKAFWYP